MIATEAKPREEVLERLGDAQSVFIVGCGDCATLCQTGGEFEVEEMKKYLEQVGKKVTGSVIPDATCNVLDTARLLRKNKEAVAEADAILVLACGSGVQAVAEKAAKRVVAGCDTIFLSTQERMGQFLERCICCGECVVDQYFGICPRARCPKGQLYGPCGGYNNGKCEVNPDEDCVWALIYERARQLGYGPEYFENLQPEPTDYEKQKRPRRLVFEPRRG